MRILTSKHNSKNFEICLGQELANFPWEEVQVSVAVATKERHPKEVSEQGEKKFSGFCKDAEFITNQLDMILQGRRKLLLIARNTERSHLKFHQSAIALSALLILSAASAIHDRVAKGFGGSASLS